MRLPKIVADKNLASNLIQPYLLEGEHFVWSSPYNTKEKRIATRAGQSLGHLFVTNLRLLFWSDNMLKPHVGVFFEDITDWKSSWMPMKSRGVRFSIGQSRYLFAAGKISVIEAEKIITKLKS